MKEPVYLDLRFWAYTDDEKYAETLAESLAQIIITTNMIEGPGGEIRFE